MKKALALTSLLVISFAVCSPDFREIRAQQTQQDQPLRLKSELVEFNVVVTDKNNRPVTDLKKEDFVLLEEGKTQPISFFSLVKPGLATGVDQGSSKQLPQAAAAFNPDQGRFIFLILDPYYISRDNYPRLREALLKFINEDLTPQDQLAIISTSGNLAVFQQVTKNKKMLSLAINAFLGGRTDYNSVAAMDEAIVASQRELGNLDTSSRFSPQFKEHTLRSTLSSLVSIAKGVATVPGRKIAIFISEYLPVLIDDDRTVSENLFSELQEVISKARQGSLAFYTLDPRGLAMTIPGGTASEYQGKSALSLPSAPEGPGASADRLLSSRTGLRELAAATGGSAILNHNDLHLGLQVALAENQAYYSLAYYPLSSARDGKFRRVKIQIANRPDLTIKTRKGYIAAAEESKKDKPESKQDQIKQALGSVVPIRNVKVAIPRSAVVKSPETGLPLVKMVIQVDANSWPFKQEGNDHLASLEVIGFAYDLNNKLVDGFSKTLNLKLTPETYSIVLREGINMRGEIKLKKAGLFNIRVVVLNRDTGEIGTSSDWVEAP